MKEEDPKVLSKVAKAIGRIGIQTPEKAVLAAPALVEAIKERKKWSDRSLGIDALKNIGVLAVPALIELLKETSGNSNIIWVIKGIGKPAIPALERALKTAEDNHRKNVDFTIRTIREDDPNKMDYNKWGKDS